MDIAKKIFKTILGILLAILAIYLGKAFIVYLALSYSGGVAFLILPFYLAYLYMAIGLLRLKKWALQMFFTIVLSALLMEIIFTVTLRLQSEFFEGIFHTIFWISLLLLPVFGLIALIRKGSEKQ